MSASGLDPRRNAFRDDLVARELEGVCPKAARYVDGELRRVTAPLADMRRAPAPDAPLDTQALYGEEVRVFEEKNGWAWGQLSADRYVGYLPSDALGTMEEPPTHRVAALRTFVFPDADIKRPPVTALGMGSRLTVAGADNGFARIAGGGFVHARHLVPLGEVSPDFVSTAAMFLGTPYLWGGKSSLGLDCSALVQVSLDMAGIACPRDSDMQADEVRTLISASFDQALVRRGDLVFWPGHVGILEDAQTILHANAHHMMVAREPVVDALKRISAAGLDVACVRRPLAD